MPARHSIAADATAFWTHRALANVYFYKARYRRHAYTRHTHIRHAIGVPELGALAFWCRGAERRLQPGCLSLINADEPHDGRGLGRGCYGYRTIYIGPEHLSRVVAGMGRSGSEEDEDYVPLFRAPAAEDPALAARLLALHRASEDPGLSALEAESRFLAFASELVLRHASEAPAVAEQRRHSPLVRIVCGYLADNLAADPSLSDLAALTGVTRFHLLRQFTRETGLPPHKFLIQLRLREAQRLLRLGDQPASIAAAVGFVDQSHLIKRFRSAYGMTPGQFVRGIEERAPAA